MFGNLGVFPVNVLAQPGIFPVSLFPAQSGSARFIPPYLFLLPWNWAVPGHEALPGDSSHPKEWSLPRENRSCPSERSISGRDASVSESPRESQRAILEQMPCSWIPTAGMDPTPWQQRGPDATFPLGFLKDVVPFQVTSLRCQENSSDGHGENFQGAADGFQEEFGTQS